MVWRSTGHNSRGFVEKLCKNYLNVWKPNGTAYGWQLRFCDWTVSKIGPFGRNVCFIRITLTQLATCSTSSKKNTFHATWRPSSITSNKRNWKQNLCLLEWHVSVVQLQIRTSCVHNYKWAVTLVDVNEIECWYLRTSLLTSMLAFYLLLTIPASSCLDVAKTKCAGFCVAGQPQGKIDKKTNHSSASTLCK